MQGMAPARRTEFFQGKLFSRPFPVFCRRIILPFTLIASKPYEFPHDRTLPCSALLDNFRYDARAHSSATLANCKFQALLHRNGGNQFDLYINVIAGHNHLGPFG
jgi:hypothetical protein